ncbi:MAG: nicotinate-nucleotide adenylyltransferase [Bacteroidetes bacterium]|nr:MAG: nicotinate-nucleotide adenylyltransferase [Bacteroidota bacterium]
MSKPEKPISSKKTGLFFGSFNPIHNGHLCIAEYMIEYGGLKEVWFVLSPHNPLKDKTTLLSDYARLEMVQAAIDDDNRFRVSDIEFHMPRPSYTIDTLTRLSEKYPDRLFVMIAGTDVLPTFHKWKNYQQLLEQYRFMIYPREEGREHTLLEHPSVQLVDAPKIEISSSFIRNSILNGKSARYFMPDSVYRLVDKYGYYLK